VTVIALVALVAVVAVVALIALVAVVAVIARVTAVAITRVRIFVAIGVRTRIVAACVDIPVNTGTGTARHALRIPVFSVPSHFKSFPKTSCSHSS
jgi:hypothetical protein